jgi:hypothetical protein
VSNYNDQQMDIINVIPNGTNDFDTLPYWIDQCASTNADHFKNHGYDIDLDCMKIPMTTINQIVKEYDITHIDYLLVDTEGCDYQILMDMNLDNIKPTYISFEHLHMDGYKKHDVKYDTLIQHFIKHGYEIYHKGRDDTFMKLV